MERASGQRLDWFFDQWLRRPGYAEVDVTWSYDPSSHQVSLDVVQGGRFGSFRFPLTLAIREADGAMRRETIQVSASPEVHVVLPDRFAATPQSLEADPDVELLARFDVHPKR